MAHPAPQPTDATAVALTGLQPVPNERPAFRAEPVAVAQAAMTIDQNADFADGT